MLMSNVACKGHRFVRGVNKMRKRSVALQTGVMGMARMRFRQAPSAPASHCHGEVAGRPFLGPDLAAGSCDAPVIMLVNHSFPTGAKRPQTAPLRATGALLVGLMGVCFGGSIALAFDGTTTQSLDPQMLMPPANVPQAPAARPVDEAFRTGARALRSGETAKGLDALSYAAAQGHAVAQWKLGRIYADGDGVTRDDAKAFQYFSNIANSHAEDYPGTPQARFVANAFVALGSYYLAGIPAAGVSRDPERARDMFSYAASYFGDAEAQYRLGRLYLDGIEGHRDPRSAGRWLALAAQKGQFEAQALLGQLLFRGDDGIPRQPARGLMWLTLARDGAAKPEDKWVVDMHEEVFAEASRDEQAKAFNYLEKWLKTAHR